MLGEAFYKPTTIKPANSVKPYNFEVTSNLAHQKTARWFPTTRLEAPWAERATRSVKRLLPQAEGKLHKRFLTLSHRDHHLHGRKIPPYSLLV
jgi:hypothetical protein